MSKIDEIGFLKLLQGKTGKYSDNAIMVDCRAFTTEKEKDRMLNSIIIIRPKGMSNEKKTMDVLKALLEKSKVARTIEDKIVEAIEQEIDEKIKELQEEIKEILGITEKETTQDGQDNQIMGGDTG